MSQRSPDTPRNPTLVFLASLTALAAGAAACIVAALLVVHTIG